MSIQLSEELVRTIESHVQDGHAASPAALLEEAVRRFVEDVRGEEDDIERAALLGIADADAGRTTTIASAADEQALHDRLTARVKSRLGAGE